MISMIVTDFFSYTLASVVISRTVEATIFRGTSEAGSMIGVYKIIVDGFGLSNYADRTSDVFGIAWKFADGIHGIIAANIEEPADI